jgi:hypothetical protein
LRNQQHPPPTPHEKPRLVCRIGPARGRNLSAGRRASLRAGGATCSLVRGMNEARAAVIEAGSYSNSFSPASLGGSQGHAPDLLKNDKWCWSRFGVEPSDRCDRRWPRSPAAARTRRGPSSRRLVPARSPRGYSGWRLRLLRVVKSCENRQVGGPYRAESVVTVHHGLTGSLWVSTGAGCCPSAARCRQGTQSLERHVVGRSDR